jgi:hypothetical protein
VIPPRATRREPIRWSKAIDRHRKLAERCFCRIEPCRRGATRCDKLAERIAAFTRRVGAIVGMRQVAADPGKLALPSSGRKRSRSSSAMPSPRRGGLCQTVMSSANGLRQALPSALIAQTRVVRN